MRGKLFATEGDGVRGWRSWSSTGAETKRPLGRIPREGGGPELRVQMVRVAPGSPPSRGTRTKVRFQEFGIPVVRMRPGSGRGGADVLAFAVHFAQLDGALFEIRDQHLEILGVRLPGDVE